MQTIPKVESNKQASGKLQSGSKLSNVDKGRKPLWRSVGETLLAATVVICVLETFFNAAGIGQQEFFEPDPLLGARHIPGKQVTWRMEGLSRDSFNSFGMRDYERVIAKPEGTKRIAILGDSAAEGLQVPLEDTFPAVLEKTLNAEATKGAPANNSPAQTKRVEVLNFGCAGYSMAQEVLQYETQVSKFKPDTVVLFFNNQDAGESVIDNSMRSLSDPKPYFYIAPNGQLTIDNGIMQARAHELAPNPVLDWLRRNSRLYGVVNQTLFSLNVNDKTYWKLKKSFAAAQHKAKIPPATYPPQNPDKIAVALLERLNKSIKANGGHLVVMMFPNTADYKDFKRQEELFRNMATKDGFGYLDLTKPFKGYKKKKELIIEYHFSKKGHQFLADLLKPYI